MRTKVGVGGTPIERTPTHIVDPDMSKNCPHLIRELFPVKLSEPFHGPRSDFLNEIYKLTGSSNPADQARRAELMDPSLALKRENRRLRVQLTEERMKQ